MKRLIYIFLFFPLLSIGQLAAPDAVGAGASVTGARGTTATVYHVTNLNDSGTGSLRDAVSASNRYIVFDVSGVITLSSRIAPTNIDNITIAGQTAPEGGITVSGGSFRPGAGCNNWIIRYMKFRGGYDDATTNDSFATLNAQEFFVDHCSVSFGTDEALTMTEDGGDTTIGNSTIQHCLIAESSTGSIVKGTLGYTVYQNLYYNITHRFPNFTVTGTGSFDIINNLVWNYQNRTIRGNDEANVIVENNYYDIGTTPIRDDRFFQYQYTSFTPTIYTDGNVYVNQNTGTPLTYTVSEINADNRLGWYFFAGTGSPYAEDQNVFDQAPGFFTTTKRAYLGTAPTVLTATQVLDSVPADVGANKYLNADGSFTEYIDYVDQGFLDNVNLGTYVDGLSSTEYFIPVIASNSRGASYDTDNDGMADTWETATFGDLTQTATGDFDSDGYENIEEFINLVDDGTSISAGYTVTPTSGLTTTESGGTDTFDVVLDFLPASDVVFNITSNSIEGTISADTLTFTTANWDTPQTITVTGQDDDLEDGNVAYTVTVSVNDVSSDDNYDGLSDTTVNLTNTDNEGGGQTIPARGGFVRTSSGWIRIKNN